MDMSIDYEQIVIEFFRRPPTGSDSEQLDAYHRFLRDHLPTPWCDHYLRMPGATGEIVEFEDHGTRFLFDLGAERVVAAFGVSDPTSAARDTSRMSGFLKKSAPPSHAADRATSSGADERRLRAMSFRDRYVALHGHRYDRGHFISHKQGGGLDVNLFPQRADINQGTSEPGRAYRAMERRCASRAGIFCFSRPLYADDTWVPIELEYGVVEDLSVPDVRVFPNR